MLCWVPAAGGRAPADPTLLASPSSSCYSRAASPSAVALPCEVVPSWLWEGGVLARREVAHEKSLYLITGQAVTRGREQQGCLLSSALDFTTGIFLSGSVG